MSLTEGRGHIGLGADPVSVHVGNQTNIGTLLGSEKGA